MIDLPPRSRNEMIASLMRRTGFCEEQGSGLDKVIREVEIFQLPPPAFTRNRIVDAGDSLWSKNIREYDSG